MKTYPRLVVLTPGILVLVKDAEAHRALMRKESKALALILLVAAAATCAISLLVAL